MTRVEVLRFLAEHSSFKEKIEDRITSFYKALEEKEERITGFFKALESSKTTKISTMNTYEEKAMCNLKAFVVKKALKGGRQWREEGKKWEKEVKKRKKEEKKRKKEEEKRKKEIEYAKLHLKAQRTKIMLKVFKTKKKTRRRKLMHQVVAHRLINKVPSSCPAEMRNRIPARAEEEKEVQMQHCEKILERSDVPREEKKGVQKESLFRRFRKLFCLDKTSESSKTTKIIEEKKVVMEEEKKMEKERTTTFTEEEKRRVEEEVEEKLKNERKVKAMRDRIQVKLYEKMTDTEDPEEKRKLMQRVITHRMINKIGVPCTGKRQDSIPSIAMKQKKEDIQHIQNIFHWSKSFSEEKKEVQSENLLRDKTSERKKITKVAIVNTNQESQEMPREEPKNMKHQNVAAWRMKLMEKLSDTNDPAEKREIMHQVVAHKLINKVPSPCSAEMHRRIPSIAMEHEEEKIHHFKNIFHWSHSFSKGEKKVQNENLLGDKTSGRKKITKKIHALRKEAAQQKETVEKEKGKDKIEEKKLVMEEEKKMEKDETNTFNEEEKRRVGEEVEAKLKNEQKVKAIRDRIQRMKLYEKMTDTEDPEEKRKLMQRVITHRMINKIGVPCTGKRRDSILCSEEKSPERCPERKPSLKKAGSSNTTTRFHRDVKKRRAEERSKRT